MKIPPLGFLPVYKEKIWGGRTLETRLGKALPSGRATGESWELSGCGSDISRCTSAPFDGYPLDTIVREYGKKIMGRGYAAEQFPLLYKFIDANDRLSIQVHPDDEQARRNRWDVRGKSECWYIVEAKPGAQIIVGFTEDITRERIESYTREGRLHEVLNFIDIAPGDVLFIPAGTVHAILEGTLLYEIQETSDITFRLHDWDRVDDHGKPRALHIEESLKVLTTDFHTQHKITPLIVERTGAMIHQLRAACRYFALEQYTFAEDHAIALPRRGSFQVLSVTDGTMEIKTPEGERTVSRGETLLLGAHLETIRINAHAGCTALNSWVPDLTAEIIGFLRERGIADDRIAELGGYCATNDLIPLLN